MTQVISPDAGMDAQALADASQEPAAAYAATAGLVPADGGPSQATGSADMARIKYGACLIVAAFLLLGIVFGIAVWRYPTASDVAAVIGTLATVTGTILGAFFGAQAGSAGKEAAEAGRRRAERTAQMALSRLHPNAAEELVRHL